MNQETPSTKTSRPGASLWKVFLGINVLVLAAALLGEFIFEAPGSLGMILWFLACEAFLSVVVLLPVFLFHLIWRRQRPGTAARRSLDAFVETISLLTP